jgi:hypothetical protein
MSTNKIAPSSITPINKIIFVMSVSLSLSVLHALSCDRLSTVRGRLAAFERAWFESHGAFPLGRTTPA